MIVYPFFIELTASDLTLSGVYADMHAPKDSIHAVRDGQTDMANVRRQNDGGKLAECVMQRFLCSIGMEYRSDLSIRPGAHKPDLTGNGLHPLAVKAFCARETIERVSFIRQVGDTELHKHHIVGTEPDIKNNRLIVHCIARPGTVLKVRAEGLCVSPTMRRSKVAIYLDKMNPADWVCDWKELRI